MRQLGASLDAVYLKDVFEDNSSVHLVMELCEGGGILERVRSGRYTEVSPRIGRRAQAAVEHGQGAVEGELDAPFHGLGSHWCMEAPRRVVVHQ